jgi:RNA polymerase sigma-70 factor (ECF subfamily)
MRRTDGELVRETLAGSWSCFGELVARYRDAVCGIAYHHLGDFEEAQDAAQETFVRAYPRLRQLREPEKFGPWLRKIATTVCADMMRKRGDRPLSLEAQPEPPREDADLEQAAARIVVRDALSKLSEKARLAVTLFYIDGYSHAEVAGFLNVPVNTVRTRLHRAKQRLREEMTTMVSDVLHQGRPDPEFTQRVVEEAMRRAGEAHQAHHTGEALRQYDEALAAVGNMPPGPERQRLRMQALWNKGGAALFPRGNKEALILYEQALAIARELGDRPEQASMMVQIGGTYGNAGRREDSVRWYEQALTLYRELGDVGGQAQCLYWLATRLIFDKTDFDQARRKLAEAAALFEQANQPLWVACAYAAVALLREVDEARMETLHHYGAVADGLREEDDVVTFEWQPGIGGSPQDDAAGFFTHDIFYQVGQLRKFLDPSVPVGGSRSGDSFSYTTKPLRTTAAVRSDAERVETPAGTFENCLLMEYVTEEADPDTGAPERNRNLNRDYLCGTRWAWYARGVGIVQFRLRRLDGKEATLRLKRYSVQPSEAYLPLALGNAWTYGHDTPGYVDKESYRVATREGDVWCLEHYDYLYKAS